MTDNLHIWNAVQKTDPDHTKEVKQRGGFTAIDAHYQIMRATEQFGPVGVGWGYETGSPIFNGDFVLIPVSLWHGDRSNTFGPVYGCSQMLGARPDADAPKKAMTDGITKALSQLGFNADVFLGKFDDNKYVAELWAEKHKENTPQKTSAEKRDWVKGNIGKAPTVEELDNWLNRPNVQDVIKSLPEPMQNEITTTANAKRNAITYGDQVDAQ